ncbi:MAG: hypothetical protein ACLRIS_12130 [Flavonifractor plautii]
MHTKKIQHFAEAAFWPAALLRRASVLAEGQNLGAGGIHFRRACEVLTVSIKITTPKGLVIFMQITVKTDISAKSKNAAERRSQITTQRNGCDLGRRSSKINAL